MTKQRPGMNEPDYVTELRSELAQARQQVKGTLRRAEKAEAKRDVLLYVCHEAHQVLFHYDIARKPGGVDWRPVEMLQAKLLDDLWTAIVKAQPELEIKDSTL